MSRTINNIEYETEYRRDKGMLDIRYRKFSMDSDSVWNEKSIQVFSLMDLYDAIFYEYDDLKFLARDLLVIGDKHNLISLPLVVKGRVFDPRMLYWIAYIDLNYGVKPDSIFIINNEIRYKFIGQSSIIVTNEFIELQNQNDFSGVLIARQDLKYIAVKQQ